MNCSCKNFQLLVGEETIQLLRVDSLRRVIIKACAVLLVRSSCCANVSMVICKGQIRYRQVDICNTMHDCNSDALVTWCLNDAKAAMATCSLPEMFTCLSNYALCLE